MPTHSVEIPRHLNRVAKSKAALKGLTLEQLITGLVEEYGAESYEAVVNPEQERDVMRLKLGVSDEDWEAARKRAAETNTTLTRELLARIEAL